MLRRLALPLLALSLVLTACPGPGPQPPEPPPGPICPQDTLAASQVAPLGALGGPARVVTGAPDWQAEHVPGEVLVLQPSGGGRLSAQSLAALSGVRTQAVLPGTTLAFTPAGEGDQAFARRLAAAGLTVQPNFVYRALGLPNDPGYPGNGGVGVAGVNAVQTYLLRIRAPQAWDFLAACGKSPVGAKTAVLDIVADAAHPDLAGRAVEQASFLEPASGPDGGSEAGHGTAAAGIIGAATSNGLGLAGVTWSGPLLTVEVISQTAGTTATLLKGLNYAIEKGAQVINMSLGVRTDPKDAALDQALTQAARSAVLVAAAGNADFCAQNLEVFYPARHPAVIAVGALGSRDSELAWYSARALTPTSRALDLVAPGGVGAGLCVDGSLSDNMLVLARGGRYELRAGTSFSAPLVSGVAALMRAANPALTAGQTRALLLESANRAGGLPLLDANAAIRAATR